jgi:polyferredoxin
MHGALFVPRFIALAVFLFLVISVNKYICAWGCQLGTLQDFIFRLNRNKRDTKGIIKQYKVPFAISNSIRIGFFVLFTVVAFVWVFDIVEYIDPFKVFNPGVVNVAGWIFIGLILLASLFVYRPWCHFFCPFGLFGWLFERFSFIKIKVHYDDCIACDACSKACPSTVMDSILKRDRTIPDCFACGNCISVCPTNAVSLASGKREKVPEGKFDK